MDNLKLPKPTDDTDAGEYPKDLQRFVIEKLPRLNGWQLLENELGAFQWHKPFTDDVIVCATPLWESEPILPVEIRNSDGDGVYEKQYGFIPTYDKNKDFQTYKKMMVSILGMAEKMK